MKTENRKKKIFETVYVAQDGVEFKDKAECERYENSAECALMAKYKPHVIKTITEWNLFGTGSEEYGYDLFDLRYDWQIDMLIQLDYLNYNRGEEKYEKIRKQLENSIGKIILIGRGDSYSGTFYIYESVEDRINRIFKQCEV